MRTYLVTKPDGTTVPVEAVSCTPTNSGGLVFMALSSDNQPQVVRAFASGCWTEVQSEPQKVVVLSG